MHRSAHFLVRNMWQAGVSVSERLIATIAEEAVLENALLKNSDGLLMGPKLHYLFH